MKVGILGLPNVGKSTIFNALTASDIPANNYPFCTIEPNVGIVSANHFMFDIREHIKQEVRIGEYCRIGMGSQILPGVILGDFTTALDFLPTSQVINKAIRLIPAHSAG